MLEHVALNQTQFRLPGVAPDARGVLVGRQGAVLLPSFDRLVAFFRLLSQELLLDDLLPALKILQVRSRLGAFEHVVLLPAGSSHLLDRCARAAALCGAQLFTGSDRHFVKYRDRRSPLGYDVPTLLTEPADLVFYGETFTQGYSRERELSFGRLLLDLELRPRPGGVMAELRELQQGETVVLTVRQGLGPKVLGYLYRHRVRALAALLLPVPAPPGERLLVAPPPPSFLVRAEDLPPRMLRLLCGLPGVVVFSLVLDQVAVQLGYRHLIRLSACPSAFQKDRFYLFTAGSGCQVLSSPPPLLPLESLLETDLPPAMVPASAVRPVAAAGLKVPLRLVHTGVRRRVKAALVPWARAGWLKQLVYALPPTLLGEYQAAPLEDGIFVVSPRGLDVLPIGALLQEAAPSVFVPVGMALSPRVDPEVLVQHLGGTSGRYLLVLPGAEASDSPRVLALAHEDLDALGRRMLAPMEVVPRPRLAEVPRPRVDREVLLVNEPLGVAALAPLRGMPRGTQDPQGPQGSPAGEGA